MNTFSSIKELLSALYREEKLLTEIELIKPMLTPYLEVKNANKYTCAQKRPGMDGNTWP